MTAMTVPPPGWAPIGARELKEHSRRYIGSGLALSGTAHVLLLVVVLGLQARAPIDLPRRNFPPVILLPEPPIPRVVVTEPSPEPGAGIPHREGGIIRPAVDPPRIEVPSSVPIAKGPDIRPGGPRQNPNAGFTRSDSAADDPSESTLVAYDVAPVPTFRPSPVYSDWQRDAGIEGRVVLHALVGRDGRVKRVNVVRDVGGLSEPARAAIARWIFRPATFGGKPVSVWVEIPVDFRL